MKRIISILLVFVMSIGVLTGCGTNKTADLEPLPEGRVTFTVGLPQKPNVTDYDDNAFTEYLEETANVDIKFVFFSSTKSEYTQQLTLMCAAEEKLPDVIVGFQFDHYTVNEFGEDGYFIDLTDYIEAYAPNYKDQMNKLDDERREYIVEKGKNTNNGATYALPLVGCAAADQLQSYMHINRTWLDNLGLQVPKTIDELKTVLQAFKTQDPNRNGVNDEIPMVGGHGIINYLINAFVCYDMNDFNVTKGKVWDPVVTDEFRQALIYANELVDEGLYSELSFSLVSSVDYKAIISPTTGPSKVGIFVGHPETMTNAATDALNEFMALPALSDATGKGGYTIYSQPEVFWTGYITKDCKYPGAAMKFLDTWFLDETMTRQRNGEKDVDWVYEEGLNFYGTESYTKVINPEAYFKGGTTWCLNVLGVMTHWNYLSIAQEGEGRVAQASRIQSEHWENLQNRKSPEETAENLVYTAEEYEFREEKATTVDDYIGDETVYFVSGEKDVTNDAEWDKFLSTLKSLDREGLMKVCQSAYDRY